MLSAILNPHKHLEIKPCQQSLAVPEAAETSADSTRAGGKTLRVGSTCSSPASGHLQLVHRCTSTATKPSAFLCRHIHSCRIPQKHKEVLFFCIKLLCQTRAPLQKVYKTSIPSRGKAYMEFESAFTTAAASEVSQLGLRKEKLCKKKKN